MIRSHIAYSGFSEHKFVIAGGHDATIIDDKGKEYIDFTSGWNVTNLGWNDPDVAEAMKQQIDKNVYAPMWTSDDIQEQYAAKLTSLLPAGLDTCCRVTGGTEGVEVAIKVARAATKRKKIIGLSDSYHGQLFASLALGKRPEYNQSIRPLVPEFIQLDYRRKQDGKEWLADVDTLAADLESALSGNDVAAVVLESGIVSGWGSAYVMPEGFLPRARELTTKYGALLVIDEVGTGFGRIGRLFGHQYVGVDPDMLVFAKGITNGGAAMGAVVTSADIIDAGIGDTNLTSTFGWTPVACAAALAVLNKHLELKTWEMAAEKAKYLTEQLQKALQGNPYVAEVRGLGLEMGLELRAADMDASAALQHILTETFNNGLHLTSDTDKVILLMPPLTISTAELDQAVGVIQQALDTIKA